MNRFFSRKRTKKLIRQVIFMLLGSLSLFYFSRAYKLIWPEKSSQSWESGIVVHVYDGDTFRVKCNHQEKRVRLLGVDAPEIGASSEKEDLWARIARRYSLYHLLKKEIRLSYEAQKEDRYGRLLAYVWTEKKRLFNEHILKDGLAQFLASANLSPEMRDRLQQAEIEAKKAKR